MSRIQYYLDNNHVKVIIDKIIIVHSYHHSNNDGGMGWVQCLNMALVGGQYRVFLLFRSFYICCFSCVFRERGRESGGIQYFNMALVGGHYRFLLSVLPPVFRGEEWGGVCQYLSMVMVGGHYRDFHMFS